MRSWFIMANKTVLEYIMFLVNLMPRHQRPETIKIVSRVSEQMSTGGKKKKKRKRRLLSGTTLKQTSSSWSIRGKVDFLLQMMSIKYFFLRGLLMFAGFSWSSWSCWPNGTRRSEGEYSQAVFNGIHAV